MAKPSKAPGIVASIVASTLLAGIFYLAGRAQTSGEVLFSWRVLATPVLYAPLLLLPGGRRAFMKFWVRLGSHWWMPLAFLTLAGTIAFETWLFMWAPRNGYGLDSSLGFLLLPICLVLGGRFILRSAISSIQWVVVALAGLAVAVKITATPQLGWVTLAVSLPFTAYFVGRTYWQLDNLAAFGVEMTLASPVALYFLWDRPGWQAELGLLIAVGIGSVIAMSAYVGASSMLPIPLFGLLSYVEPMLLVVAAIILGEQMHGADGAVYAILALALALLAFAGFRDVRRLPKPRRDP